jgi:hypothetical protein
MDELIEEKRKIASRLVGKSLIRRKENSFDYVSVMQSMVIIVSVIAFMAWGLDRFLNPKSRIAREGERYTQIMKAASGSVKVGGDDLKVDEEVEQEKSIWEVAKEKKIRVENVNGYYVELDMRYAVGLLVMAFGGLLLSLVGLVMIAKIIKEEKEKIDRHNREHDRSHGNALGNIAAKLGKRLGMKRDKQNSRAEVVAEHSVLRNPLIGSEVKGEKFVLDEGITEKAKPNAERPENLEGYQTESIVRVDNY